MEVSQETYEEIERYFKNVGYHHVFLEHGIDMHGVCLVKAQPSEVQPKRAEVVNDREEET
jgi:hypothetical protein